MASLLSEPTGSCGPFLPAINIMGLFCFLRVNTVNTAQDAWHERQGMFPVLPDTQHRFVCTKAGAGDGIKGQWL